MKKTNFDRYLEKQLQDPTFANIVPQTFTQVSQL